MNRFIPIEEDEILTSPENAGRMLSRAMHRKHSMRFHALCPIGGGVLIAVLESTEEPPPDMEFVFAPFEDSTFDGAVSTIRARLGAGYDILGSFPLAGNLWGLFAREKHHKPAEQ